MIKYIINKNIKLKKSTINDIKNIIKFQEEIINDMENKELFKPLIEEEFTYPIMNNGLVYLLYFKNEIIGLFVLTINPKDDIINEYQLEDTSNIAILDSVMIKREFRGSKLQLQGMKIIDIDCKKLNIDKIVATVHPDNKYSLNNLLEDNYKIINTINIHGGIRNILIKEVK